MSCPQSPGVNQPVVARLIGRHLAGDAVNADKVEPGAKVYGRQPARHTLVVLNHRNTHASKQMNSADMVMHRSLAKDAGLSTLLRGFAAGSDSGNILTTSVF